MSEVQNPFVYTGAAVRYRESRPYFHPLVMERVRARLDLHAPLEHAVDVGCGTGQSARALIALAKQVVGTDLSSTMLAQAEPHPQVTYLHAPAEALPLEDGWAGLMTASLAFHWFDRVRFLSEAARVLEPGGHLVIYNNFFTGRMLERPDFETAMRDLYQQFPSPPRHWNPLTPEVSLAHGFEMWQQERYEHTWTFTLEELIAYLLTQSNFIAPIEQGGLGAVGQLIEQRLKNFFSSERATFLFEGPIEYLRKA